MRKVLMLWFLYLSGALELPGNKGGEMRSIPIKAACEIAKKYGYEQVIVIGRKTGEKGQESVATYGVNKEHCNVAAKIGVYIKHEIMGWPKERVKGE